MATEFRPDSSTSEEASLHAALRSRGASWTWLAVGVALLCLSIGVFWAWTSDRRGPVYVEPATDDRQATTTRRPVARRPGVLWIAGSGTNLPLTNVLARSYVGDALGQHPVVYESIGSSGGLTALRDGVIDIALVSREATPAELEPDFEVFPYARVAVVFAAHVDVPIRRLSRDEVIDIYAGTRAEWIAGQPIHVLLREPGDSGTRAALAGIPGFADADAAARAPARARVLYRDSDMQDALLSTPGAIGLFDLGAVELEQLPIRVLAFDGVTPSPEALRQDTYRLEKQLAFVVSKSMGAVTRRFLAFVYSPAGRARIEAGGYLPLAPPRPIEDGP